jgi:hypothetical protein
MKRAAAILLAAVFLLGTAAAAPLGEGGGSSSDDSESNLAGILMVTVVVGFAALLVGDIISDNAEDSQDALAGIMDSTAVVEETGVDWNQLNGDSTEARIPVMAVAVFQADSGRDLARYLSALLAPGEQTNYLLSGTPVALGSMNSAEAAATGFTFMDCDLFVTGDDEGIQLFERDNPQPVWTYYSESIDSNTVRRASANLMEFLSAP